MTDALGAARSVTRLKPRSAHEPWRPQPAPTAEAEAELARLANLGPKSARVLVAAGIGSLAQLRRLGAVAAYAQVKRHEPGVTLNLLWALEGALSSLPWQTVAKEHRTSLLLALEQHRDTSSSVEPPCPQAPGRSRRRR